MAKILVSVGRRWLGFPVVLAAAWAAAASMTSLAIAQSVDGDFEGERTYKQADGKEVAIKEPAKKDRSKITAIERNGKTNTAEEEKLITDYFRFKVAELTWKENISELPKKRKELKTKDLSPLGRAEASDLHVRFNKILLDEMQKVAADKRYPRAVQINAVLLIGELDQREPKGLDAGVPLPEAEPVLFGLLKDESLHEGMRIVALVGLMRHAESGMPANRNAELVDEATKLLEVKEAPKGRSAAGHIWLRMLACDTIGILASNAAEANQPKVVSAVAAYAEEKGLELWLRCRAAATLGKFEAKALQPAAKTSSENLAALVVDISKTHDRLLEAAGIEAKKKKKKTMTPPKPEAEGEEDAAPPISENVQKVASEDVVEQLLAVRLALTGAEINAKEKFAADQGLYAASDPAGQQFIKDVVDLIDNKMIKKLKDTKKTAVEQLADVSAEGAALADRLKALNADKATEGEGPEKGAEAPAASAKTAKEPARPSGKPPAGNSGAAESAVGSP